MPPWGVLGDPHGLGGLINRAFEVGAAAPGTPFGPPPEVAGVEGVAGYMWV